MRLTDLNPRWIIDNEKGRVGFLFDSPTDKKWRQSCFASCVPRREQWRLFDEMSEEEVQGCNPDSCWTIEGGIENAAFETITVRPSMDGSKGGLWHGFITNGAIA